MKTITAILIDPFACEVKAVEISSSNLQSYYDALSHESMEVHAFDVSGVGWLERGDGIFVDDEGLFKSCARFFFLRGAHQPFAGKGLIVGSTPSGNSISAKTDIALVRERVRFLERSSIGGLMRVTKPWVKDTVQ